MKQKIVILTWFYQSQPGFLDFKYRIRALAERHDVTLVMRHDDFRVEFEALPLKIVILPTAGTGKADHLRFLWRAARFAREQQPALVVLLGSQLSIAGRLLGGLPSVLYWNEHPTHFFDLTPRNPLKRWSSQWLLDRNYRWAACSTLVMPIGEAHAEDLLAHGLPASKMRLIYMGVESRFADIQRPPAHGGPVRVVYTGTVMKDRGRDVMLDGLAQATRAGADVHLTIVGAFGDELAFCRQRVVELGIADRVEVVGRVPGEQIPGYLANADAGICIWADKPWWRFNPPTKLFEYLVAGLPVLGSRIRTHTDYVTDWHNGVIFDYDAAAFAACLQALHARRDELPALSARARESGRRYLWNAIEPEFVAACAGAMGVADARAPRGDAADGRAA